MGSKNLLADTNYVRKYLKWRPKINYSKGLKDLSLDYKFL